MYTLLQAMTAMFLTLWLTQMIATTLHVGALMCGFPGQITPLLTIMTRSYQVKFAKSAWAYMENPFNILYVVPWAILMLIWSYFFGLFYYAFFVYSAYAVWFVIMGFSSPYKSYDEYLKAEAIGE